MNIKNVLIVSLIISNVALLANPLTPANVAQSMTVAPASRAENVTTKDTATIIISPEVKQIKGQVKIKTIYTVVNPQDKSILCYTQRPADDAKFKKYLLSDKLVQVADWFVDDEDTIIACIPKFLGTMDEFKTQYPLHAWHTKQQGAKNLKTGVSKIVFGLLQSLNGLRFVAQGTVNLGANLTAEVITRILKAAYKGTANVVEFAGTKLMEMALGFDYRTINHGALL